jgi:hypothetical protein
MPRAVAVTLLLLVLALVGAGAWLAWGVGPAMVVVGAVLWTDLRLPVRDFDARSRRR